MSGTENALTKASRPYALHREARPLLTDGSCEFGEGGGNTCIRSSSATAFENEHWATRKQFFGTITTRHRDL